VVKPVIPLPNLNQRKRHLPKKEKMGHPEVVHNQKRQQSQMEKKKRLKNNKSLHPNQRNKESLKRKKKLHKAVHLNNQRQK
jgi:hypothetical protein